jgi:hypothetical protein
MRNTGICLFVYNRHDHTKKILKSLSECSNFNKFKIYLFGDSFKFDENNDKNRVRLVRKEVLNFKKINKNIFIKFSKTNLGLYKNIIRGISYVIKKHSAVIVLEDDLVVRKNFLNFMCNSLEKYKNKKNILQISGYSYPINCNSNKAYFLKRI